MKLKDMFGQYFKDREKEDRRDSGQEPRPTDAERKSSSDKEAVPFTGTPPGSDIQASPEQLDKITPGTKGAR